MKTSEELVAKLLAQYDTAEMDRLIAYYRREAIAPAWREVEREVQRAEANVRQVVDRLDELGASDALVARNAKPTYPVPMNYRYRSGS